MQAVAAEPAVALEALPPATFGATFATFDCIELHHKENQGGKIPRLKNMLSSIKRRSVEQKREENFN